MTGKLLRLVCLLSLSCTCAWAGAAQAENDDAARNPQAGARLAQETPDRRNLRWQGWGTSLGYSTILGQNWNLAAQAYIDERYYEGTYPLFRERRKDQTIIANLTVSNRAIALAGYMPEVTVGWSQTDSTIPLYDRQNRILMLGLRRLF